MHVPSTGIVGAKNSAPVLDKGKGGFTCRSVRKDFDEGERTYVGTKLEHRFFQQEKLNAGDDGGLGAGSEDVAISLLGSQRSSSPAACRRRCRQSNPSHSK